jgi:hypothetical protein
MPVSDLYYIVRLWDLIVFIYYSSIQLLLIIIINDGFWLISQHILPVLFESKLPVDFSCAQWEHIMADVVLVHDHLE